MLRRLPSRQLLRFGGNVAGFGMSLVAACDLAIAADNARFTRLYADRHHTDGGQHLFLPRVVGLKRAAEPSCSTGRWMRRRRAGVGLINKVVANDALEPRQPAWRRIRQGSAGMAGVKSLLNASLQNPAGAAAAAGRQVSCAAHWLRISGRVDAFRKTASGVSFESVSTPSAASQQVTCRMALISLGWDSLQQAADSSCLIHHQLDAPLFRLFVPQA